MVTGKPTIKITEDNFLILEGDIGLLTRIRKRIISNEQEELLINILEKKYDNHSLKFYINKQSALNNNLHLIDESMSTLGDIEVEIFTENSHEVIEWFTS